MTEYADLPQEAKQIISEEDYALIQDAFTTNENGDPVLKVKPHG